METNKVRNLRKNKKGVFGLSAIQTFFVMLLGLALLAYVIVIIMGSLQNTTILPPQTLTKNETNAWANSTNYSLLGDTNSASEYNFVIVAIYNATSGNASLIPAANYTLVGNNVNPFMGVLAPYITNTSPQSANGNWTNVSIIYSFQEPTVGMSNANGLVGNVSTGVTSFFSNINPVYAILAVLIIILVLVVLVRVVQAPNSSQNGVQL